MLDLGTELRQAQDDGDRDRLRALTAERRSLLGEVARAAASRAEEAGQRVGDAAIDEVQQTLQAALASPEAAAAVRTGRLVRALDADGLDPVDLADAVAGGAPEAEAPPARRRARSTSDDDREARRAEERRKRLAAAKDRADESAARSRDAEAAAEDGKREVTELREQLDDLQARLEAAERALESAEAAAAEARDESDEAAAEVERITTDD